MVFVFGTTERGRPRGLVVDRCLNCLDLRWFSLVDHHRAFHAYFIPLGRGKYLFTSRRCEECGADFPLERDDFIATLPQSAQRELNLEEGLRRTNPRLARRFAEIDDLLAEDETPYRNPNDESRQNRLAQAVLWMKELERRSVDVTRWLERFQGFARLSATEQELLCAQLEGFHEATVD